MRVVDGRYALSIGDAGLVVGWCGSGCWVVAWVVVRHYSLLVGAGYGHGGGCAL